MNIHEYQAKQVLARYGIATPRGGVAFNLRDAEEITREIGPGPFMVKAQVHAGGRGKGGGIRKAKDLPEMIGIARRMFGMRLITPQTAAQGRPVSRVLVEESLPITRELYLGVTLDRSRQKIVVIGSSAGGMEIEEVAAKFPDKIFKMFVEPGCGLSLSQARDLALSMGLEGAAIGVAAATSIGLCKAYVEKDCTLAEINPLGVTAGGKIIALDAKMNIDDNSLYRHADLAALRDIEQEDPRDVEAGRLNLNYVNLTGNIGCIVNGAGLGMATLDILHYYGGEAANFLDAGAGASHEVVKNAFHILAADPKVKGIFINMFGGITRCDVYARGIVDALNEEPLRVPLVVRLEGTNVEMGRNILQEAAQNIIYAASLEEAAQRIIGLVKAN
jgi:succinyl-CoA synthetase beta subunit